MNSKILSEKIQNIFEKYKIPSLSVIITNKDQNLYENYFGFKNSKNKTPFDELSIVRIASMTKPITSLCIFQLIEQNLISLETNLQDIDNKNVEDYRKRWTSKDRTSFLVTSPDLSKETKSFVDQSEVIVLCLGECFGSAEKPGDIDDLSLDPDQLAYAIKMDELAITLNKPMIIVLTELQ